MNIVMPNRHFENLREFEVYATALAQVIAKPVEFKKYASLSTEHFNPREPFLILFPETPFAPDYFPSRKEAKASARSLASMLESVHPLSRIAFALNEGSKYRTKKTVFHQPVHSNTGYLISAGKYSVRPKIMRAQGDNSTQTFFAALKSHYGEQAQALETYAKQAWNARAIKLGKSKKPFATEAFESGHNIEHRICLDWFVKAPHDKSLITAISASGLDAENLERLTEARSAVVVNDAGTFGRQIVVHGKTILLNLGELDHAELDKLLTEKKLKIHLVD